MMRVGQLAAAVAERHRGISRVWCGRHRLHQRRNLAQLVFDDVLWHHPIRVVDYKLVEPVHVALREERDLVCLVWSSVIVKSFVRNVLHITDRLNLWHIQSHNVNIHVHAYMTQSQCL